MENKISGVYKIENTVTGDFYIGSSRNIKNRWWCHKSPSTWKHLPNSPMYKDMQKYGVENFQLTILCEVEPEQLTIMEQKMIQELCPTYNKNNAKGKDIERYKDTARKYEKKYCQSEKGKEVRRKSHIKYYQSEKGKEVQRKILYKYQKSEKGKEVRRKSQKKYYSQLCSYKGEILTLSALAQQFHKAGIGHPYSEAKKYLIKNY